MASNGRDRLDQIEQLLQDVALRTADNTRAIDNNINAINGLINVTGQMQENFAAFITVVRGLQTESVRIQQRLEEYVAQTNRRLERLEGNGEP